MRIFTALLKGMAVISFGTKYWFLLLIGVIISTFAIVMLLYYKNRKLSDLSPVKRWILYSLRFVSVFLLLFLLLSPFVKNLKKIIRKPIVIAVWDNSSSLLAWPDSTEAANLINQTRNEIQNGISSDYSLIEYSFGESTRPAEQLDFSEKKSDYSEVISTISNRHFNDNIGAVIVAGDGIYNQGKNPVNLMREVNFPVYAIGFGDTTENIDARIQNIRVNRTTFSGNKFPVETELLFSKLNGKTLKFSVFEGNTEVASTMITPTSDNFFWSQEFLLDAGAAGLKHFSARVQVAENEKNIKNNTAGFVINVLESKQKIVIISDGPHPDIGAIKNTLDLQSIYDVSVFTEEPYPADLSEFNLLILNQLPTMGNSAAEILKKAEEQRLPVLFMVGLKTFIPQFNTITQGVKIIPMAGTGEEAQAYINTGYAVFNPGEELKQMLPKFPPLLVPFADYELAPGFTPLLYQRIMKVETGKPLLATGLLNGRKTGYLFGEGIWRWRLYDYASNQNHNSFNELVNQLVQYLSLRQNEDNFIVEFSPVYAEIDNIILGAEVYNDAFEKITSEEVTIELQNQEGKEFNFTFDVSGSNYFLNIGHLPTSDYTFTANVTLGDKTFKETGSFTVTAVNFENINTEAQHSLLYQMAAQSGGKFYLPAETGNLMDELKTGNKLKPASYYQEMINELLNLKFLFFVILLLLSVEWFLRKFWGIF